MRFPFALTAAFCVAFSSLAQPAAPGRVLILGDSLSAGYGVEPAQAYPALLQKKIEAAGLKFKVMNAGVSGDTSADGLARVDWLLKRPVDVFLLELGANDGLRGESVTNMAANLQAILDKVRGKNPQARLIIAGMQMPPNLGAEYDRAFRQVFPDLAAKNHAELVPFLLAGVAAIPGLNQDDQIHPTAAGHQIVAENVWRVLKPVLDSLTPGRTTP